MHPYQSIAIGSDHRGDGAARLLAETLKRLGYQVSIVAECGGQPCDYPDGAWSVSRAVARAEFDAGILICGSGIGVSIAANKVQGIRAALVHDDLGARMSRSHNDANVLCLAADTTSAKEITSISTTWLQTEFEGGRHARRVRKIEAIERGEDPTHIDRDAKVG